MYSNEQIARMPITEVINLSGGNGLASPAFQMPLDFLGLIGWEHIEKGVEALVCDGQIVPRTRLTADWLRLIGRTKYFRRVLLQPAPMSDISAKALTKDQLELTLIVSAKYNVVDPIYVASLQAPLTELRDLIVGLIAEYIRSDTLDSIFSDDGSLRSTLKDHLENAASLLGHYRVTEILKALPTGDERLLELVRQKRIAETRSGLIEIEGRNKEKEAGYQQSIDRQSALVQDELANRQHVRDMEKQAAQLAAEKQISAYKVISDIASSGIDVRPVLPLLGAAVAGAQNALPTPSEQNAPLIEANLTPTISLSRIEKERAALASLQSNGLIQSFEIFESQTRLDGVVVKLPAYEIVLTCADTYPTQAPDVIVRFSSGKKFEPQVYWIPNVSDSLAQVVVSVIPQVKVDASSAADRPTAYRLNMDDLDEAAK